MSNNENYMDAFRYNVGILRNNYGWSVRMLAEKADLSADTLKYGFNSFHLYIFLKTFPTSLANFGSISHKFTAVIP